jgi:hypothetical protein
MALRSGALVLASLLLSCLFLTGNCVLDECDGDVNGDGTADISDPISLLSWLFLGTKAPPPCY